MGCATRFAKMGMTNLESELTFSLRISSLGGFGEADPDGVAINRPTLVVFSSQQNEPNIVMDGFEMELLSRDTS